MCVHRSCAVDAAIDAFVAEACGPGSFVVASAAVVAVQRIEPDGSVIVEYIEHHSKGLAVHEAVGLVEIHSRHLGGG